jgi:hypothetical protein
MSTYRYARDSRTPADREAAKWQRKVDETSQALAMYERQIADGRQLSQYDAMRQRQAVARLAKLMAENPYEAA